MLCSTDRVETYPKGRDPGLLQRGGPAGDQLQDLQVLGVGVPGLPDLDANANAVAIQHIKLENEGWDRDVSVTEPTGPS
jgi:hypothetical protein